MGARRILCIDDDEAVVQVLGEGLRRLGHEAIACSDARVALKIFKEQANSIKLVIADIVMPGITGWTLARRIRSISPDTPVILMTAYLDLASRGLGDKNARLGIAAILAKPFTKSDLLEAIARALRQDEPA